MRGSAYCTLAILLLRGLPGSGTAAGRADARRGHVQRVRSLDADRLRADSSCCEARAVGSSGLAVTCPGRFESREQALRGRVRRAVAPADTRHRCGSRRHPVLVPGNLRRERRNDRVGRGRAALQPHHPGAARRRRAARLLLRCVRSTGRPAGQRQTRRRDPDLRRPQGPSAARESTRSSRSRSTQGRPSSMPGCTVSRSRTPTAR